MLVPGLRAYNGAAERRSVRAVRHVVTSAEPRVVLMHVLYPLRAAEGRLQSMSSPSRS